MRRPELAEADWARIKDLRPGQEGDPGVTAADHRLFGNAVLGIAKTGAPWRDLPGRFGDWNSVWKRSDRWAKEGAWRRAFEAPQGPDLEWPILDPGAPACGRERRGRSGEALGRPRGGFGTKRHSAVDGRGNPVECVPTGGQEAGVTRGGALIEGQEAEAVIADKGYDGDAPVATIEARRAKAVIPPVRLWPSGCG